MMSNKMILALTETMNDYATMVKEGHTECLSAIGRIAEAIEENGYKIKVVEINGKAKYTQ